MASFDRCVYCSGFYIDMYLLALLASRFFRSNIRMSFKNYSCTCSCCFWRSSLCTCTFWLKYIRHSYVAAFFFLPLPPTPSIFLTTLSYHWLADFTCLALGRLCPPTYHGRSMVFLLSLEIIYLRGLCNNPCEIKHLIWCGVERTMDQTSIEFSKLK